MKMNQTRPALSAFLLMVTMSLLSTALSFGRGSFTLYYSLMVAAGAVSASFLSTPGWGMIYDTFGTYTPALVAMPILQTAAIAALVMAFRKKK